MMKNGKIMMSAECPDKTLISEIFLKNGINQIGFCRFSDILPLIQCRAVSRLPESPETVIMCCFPYFVRKEKDRNLSYYACVRDYHDVAGKILGTISEQLKNTFPNYNFPFFADNSPVREVYAGLISGLGKRGMNGLLINEKYGSFVFLGEIVTDMKILCEKGEIKDCLRCRQCIKNCPSGALGEEGVDAEICLSAVTQKKKTLSEHETDLIRKSGIAWGCDVCQTSCPMNRNVESTNIAEFIESTDYFLKSDEVHDKINGRAYAWRGEKVIKRNLEILGGKTI